ncbi:MAG: Nramp family divalent metal transporter [Candidatus Berkelbacteria bacterium]|nr:Nramp family divalent metal transporter [Candidatus Berkelbacteria bacterium]
MEEAKKKPSRKVLEKLASVPAIAVEETIEATETVGRTVIKQESVKKAKEYWEILGPGLSTGAADDDPSGIATYSQTGARYGYSLAWLAAFSFPLMAVVQEMCARIGLVTGRGLAANIKHYFPKWVLYTTTILLFIANTFNIGADFGALAAAVRLFFPTLSFTLIVIAFAVLILGLQVFSSYRNYAKYLKWLALVLFSYVLSTLMIRGLNWRDVGLSVVTPHLDFSRDQIILICAILGTTISPYLFFWQTSQEIEEKIMQGKTKISERQHDLKKKHISDMRIDVWSGMFLSNLAMFFIITACAATLNASGLTNIQTAAQAAEALRPLAGDYSYLLFAVGIIGVGLLGIPILAGSASYAIAESFGWKEGLSYKLKQASGFYGVIILSIVIGLLLNFVGLDPIKALIYSAVANGLVAPVVLVLIVLLSSNRKVMNQWVSGPATKIVGWAATVIMVIAGLATIYSIFTL